MPSTQEYAATAAPGDIASQCNLRGELPEEEPVSIKSFSIYRATWLGAVLLVSLCGQVFAAGDAIVLHPGAEPALPEPMLGNSAVLRGTRPATPPENRAGGDATSTPAPSPAVRWVCPPGFDCSRDDRRYDRSGYSRNDADY